MIVPENIDSYLKENLSPKRYRHTMGVVDMALKLADRWNVDKQRAFYAALCHDVAKNLSDEDLINSAIFYGIDVDEYMRRNPSLLHSEVGAKITKEKFGITDEAILEAISNHTLGKIHMSGLDKVIFLADMVEENRTYDGVEQLRFVCFEELDLAMIQAYERTINFTEAEGREVHPRSIDSLNYIKKHFCLEPYSERYETDYVYPETNNDKPKEDMKVETTRPIVEKTRKTAVVTGGSGDIGQAICFKLALNGYNVVCCSNENTIEADRLVNALLSSGCYAVNAVMDITDQLSVINTCEDILEEFSYVDVLVNCAGISSINVLSDVSEDEWMHIMDVNINGTFRVTKALLDSMIERKHGSIINISSMWGQTGASCEVAYSTSKAAMIGFTKALAKELGPSNIRVNCVCPGLIETKMNEHLDSDTIEALIDATPLERQGIPGDVANAVAFLASDEASFITGDIMSVNGGFVI